MRISKEKRKSKFISRVAKGSESCSFFRVVELYDRKSGTIRRVKGFIKVKRKNKLKKITLTKEVY